VRCLGSSRVVAYEEVTSQQYAPLRDEGHSGRPAPRH